jgi:hypothetical protein
MVSSLEKVNAVITDEIDYPMFLSKTPRPSATCQVFEGLRFTNTSERVAHYCFNQIESA